MRREGFELQVSRPEVITKEVEGRLQEPLERAVVDVPDEHVGTVTQAVAPRKGQVTDLRPGDAGRTIVSIEAASRGLLGFRSELMTSTRGTALVHQHQAGWIPWVGDLPHRIGGAMTADRKGLATGFALDNLQKRGELFIGPGVEVYEGMIIGEASRPEEMVVNPTKGKELTNIRTHASDDAIKLRPPRQLTLELAMEWISDDELLEVTPDAIRVRKRHLAENERRRHAKKAASTVG
jgi:GTP-binding protein